METTGLRVLNLPLFKPNKFYRLFNLIGVNLLIISIFLPWTEQMISSVVAGFIPGGTFNLSARTDIYEYKLGLHHIQGKMILVTSIILLLFLHRLKAIYMNIDYINLFIRILLVNLSAIQLTIILLYGGYFSDDQSEAINSKIGMVFGSIGVLVLFLCNLHLIISTKLNENGVQ